MGRIHGLRQITTQKWINDDICNDNGNDDDNNNNDEHQQKGYSQNRNLNGNGHLTESRAQKDSLAPFLNFPIAIVIVFWNVFSDMTPTISALK